MFKYDFSQWPKTLYNTYVYIINNLPACHRERGHGDRSAINSKVYCFLFQNDEIASFITKPLSSRSRSSQQLSTESIDSVDQGWIYWGGGGGRGKFRVNSFCIIFRWNRITFFYNIVFYVSLNKYVSLM